MNALWPAIIAAVAGISGVTVGQALQNFRDRTSHERELSKERAKRTTEANVRFMEARLAAFGDYLSDLAKEDRVVTSINRWRSMNELPETKPLPEQPAEAFRDQYSDLFMGADSAIARIELLAEPRTHSAAVDAMRAALTWVQSAITSRDRAACYDKYLRSRTEAVEIMRAELRETGSPKTDSVIEGDQASPAP